MNFCALDIKYWIINDINQRTSWIFQDIDQSILRDYIFINEPKHAMNLFLIIAQSCLLDQGQLQIWTEHSKLIFENLKPVEKSKNHFSIN